LAAHIESLIVPFQVSSAARVAPVATRAQAATSNANLFM
jgi:hypothetical protein